MKKAILTLLILIASLTSGLAASGSPLPLVTQGVFGTQFINNFAGTLGDGTALNHAGAPTAWFGWTPPQSGTLTVSTDGSGFDTVLAAFSGYYLDSLNLVASNDDHDSLTTSQVSFAVTGGSPYTFAAAGMNGGYGTLHMNWSLSVGGIANQTINEDTSTGALPITTSGLTGTISYSGTSSNTSLVPNSNIVFGSSGTTNTVSATPAADTNGTTIITVIASDTASHSVTCSFTLTVTPVNDAPTVLPVPWSCPHNSSVNVPASTLRNAARDVDGDICNLYAVQAGATSHGSVSWLGGPNVVYTPTAGYSGSDSFTFTIMDSHGASGTGSVNLTVQ